MAKKAELEKALDIVEDVLTAENDKDKAKAVKAADKFEDSTTDKALAQQVESIVDKLEAPQASGQAPEAAQASGQAPVAKDAVKTEEQKAQEQADFEAARQRVRA